MSGTSKTFRNDYVNGFICWHVSKIRFRTKVILNYDHFWNDTVFVVQVHFLVLAYVSSIFCYYFCDRLVVRVMYNWDLP